MANTVKKSPTWTPFRKTGTGKSYTPKPGMPASKQHFTDIKNGNKQK